LTAGKPAARRLGEQPATSGFAQNVADVDVGVVLELRGDINSWPGAAAFDRLDVHGDARVVRVAASAAPRLPGLRQDVLAVAEALSEDPAGRTTGTRWALYGDFKAGYVIGDRLGITVSLVPHLLGATNRFPTGTRGLYAYWRNDARVKVPNALRYGEVL
jgi:hypothetical protein